MTRARRAVVVFCIAAALGISGAALAGDGKKEAARAAKAEHGGRVLDVKRAEDGYRVKLLKDSGKVKIVFVPTREKSKSDKPKIKDSKRKARGPSPPPLRDRR